MAVVLVAVCIRQEGFGVLVIQTLPPQAEKEHTVLHFRHHLLHTVGVGERVRRLCIRREPETSIGYERVDLRGDFLVLLHDVDQLCRLHLRRKMLPKRFERGDILLDLRQHLFNGSGGRCCHPGPVGLGVGRHQGGEIPARHLIAFLLSFCAYSHSACFLFHSSLTRRRKTVCRIPPFLK